MGVDNSRMGLTFAHPRVTRAKQEEALLEAGASWIVHVGKDCPTWKEAIKQVRPGDVVFVYAGTMVPASRQKCNMFSTAQWSSFMTELHKRGGTLFEVITGLKSATLKQQRELNKETVRLLRLGGKKLPHANKPAGRPAAEADAEIKRIWTSRDYATNGIACKHMPHWQSKDGPKPWTERMCRDRFGPSGRPFKRRYRRKSRPAKDLGEIIKSLEVSRKRAEKNLEPQFQKWLKQLERIMRKWDKEHGDLPFKLPLKGSVGETSWRGMFFEEMTPQEAFDFSKKHWMN